MPRAVKSAPVEAARKSAQEDQFGFGKFSKFFDGGKGGRCAQRYQIALEPSIFVSEGSFRRGRCRNPRKTCQISVRITARP